MKTTSKTFKYREKCGDCYYNGSCILNLSECLFIKKKAKGTV